MEYNTRRPNLAISEYGRNVQKMISHACSVEDRDERNKIAKSIVSIMAQMNPQIKQLSDYDKKLWSHMFIISDFKLDVDSPYPIPTEISVQEKPATVPYPNRNFKYKHYGNNIHLFIQKAKAMDEGPEKQAFSEAIANMMKKAYLNFNRDSVNDGIILKQLAELSDRKITLSEDFVLENTASILAKNPKPSYQRKKRHSSHHRNKGRKTNR